MKKFLLLVAFATAVVMNAGEKNQKDILNDLDKRVEVIRKLATIKIELQQTRGKIAELEKNMKEKETELAEIKSYLSDKFIPELDKILADIDRGEKPDSGINVKEPVSPGSNETEKEPSIFPAGKDNQPESSEGQNGKTVAVKDNGFSWWPF